MAAMSFLAISSTDDRAALTLLSAAAARPFDAVPGRLSGDGGYAAEEAGDLGDAAEFGRLTLGSEPPVGNISAAIPE